MSKRSIETAAILAAARRVPQPFLVPDICLELGLTVVGSGTRIFHIVRDLADEGVIRRSNDGYYLENRAGSEGE